MKTDSTYMLQVGHFAKNRLELQHEVFKSGTAAFLSRAGIEAGKKVLVVGCGCGFETEMIAEMVGKEILVTAVDNSREQLEIAQNRAQVHGISNIRYIEASVYTLSALFEADFDIVYCRFLLMNLQHPLDALKEMLTVTKQNGVIACEEGEVSTCFTLPTCHSFQLLIHLILSLGEKNKIDFNIGPKLPDIFSKLQLEDISVEISQPLVTKGEHKYLSAMASKEMKPSFLKYGLLDLDNKPIDETTVDAMTEALEKEVALNPELIHGQCSVTQIIGRKR